MATADCMQTTAGSWALLGSIVPKDAHIVRLLREAGAVILGKTNLDEVRIQTGKKATRTTW
jgi:amidase